MSKINNQEKGAPNKKKKTFFFTCDGCSKVFAAGTGIIAPKNDQQLRQVCRSCFKQCVGSSSPMPSVASPTLILKFGSYMTSGGTGVLRNSKDSNLSNANNGPISQKIETKLNSGSVNPLVVARDRS